MENEKKLNYLLLDEKGMIIEQNESFNDNIVGDVGDIIHKSKKISKENEMMISVQFENKNLVIVNDLNKKISVCSLSDKN